MQTNTHPNPSPDNPDDRRSGEEVRLRLLEGMLRDEERDMSPGDIQLLDEIELCASTKRNARTRKEYRQMQEHWLLFLKQYGKDFGSATWKHVEFFAAHLQGDSAVAMRLVEQCEFCQASGRGSGGLSPSYVKRHLSAIRAAYEYLVREGVVQGDPASGVKRPSTDARKQYIPSEDEVRALFAYTGTPRSRVVVRWAYYAPARRSELVSPRWEDIDEYNRWHYTAKGPKSHALKLHPELTRALRAYREFQQREARRHPAMARALANPETAWVFMTKSGKQMTGGQLVRILKRHAVRAGVAVRTAPSDQWDTVDGKTSRLSPHALRRAWATHSLNDRHNPVPLDVVQVVLGHASIETTRRYYAGTDDGRADDALNRRRL